MPIYTYNGEEPTVIQSENVEKILEVMLQQLRVLNQLAHGFVLVPAGTKLSGVTEIKK